MEELYSLLNDRLSNVDEISTALAEITDHLRSRAPDSRSLSPTRLPELQEFSRFINQMKRIEKVRVIKEDEIIDLVFNMKGFDLAQRQRFQEASLEIMQQIGKDFVYKKSKTATDVKDLASLYLNFFVFSDMKNRVEDLKRVYVDNKIRGLPIISVLAKWLIELTRDHFKSVLKDIMQEYETLSFTGKGVTAQKVLSPKTGRYLKSPKDQKVMPWEENEAEKSLQETRGYDEVYNFANATKRNLRTQSESTENLIRPEKMNGNPPSLDTFTISHIQLHRQSPNIFTTPASSNITPKHIEPLPQIIRKKNPMISVCVNVTPGFLSRNLDIIEDLDPICNPVLNQIIGVTKSVKRLKGKHQVSVDTDRKKDLLTQTFKSLYSRNCDVERTITNFQAKIWQKKKIRFFAQPKKGEIMLEDFTIGYFERFYNNLLQNSPDSPTNNNNRSPGKKHKLQEETSSTQQTCADEQQRPSTMTLLRRNRSNEAIAQLHISETAQNESDVMSPVAGEGKSPGLKTESSTSEMFSENYFRILKIANYLHKGTPKASKEKVKGEKRASDLGIIKPMNLDTVERILSNPNFGSYSSEGGLSPLTMKRLTHLAPYLKKISGEEDELVEKQSSLQLYKIKACNLIAHSELNKNPSVDFSKHSSLKDVGGSKEIVKFGDFVKAKHANRVREGKLDSEGVKSQDFGKKALELSQKNNPDSSLKNFLSFESDSKGDVDVKKKKEKSLTRKTGRRKKLLNSSIGYWNKEIKTCEE